MITLLTSPGSPYGRKARIAIIHLGLQKRVSVAPAQTSNPEDAIHEINPLHKMPALTSDKGTAIYDSPVILEYLDWLAGGGKIVPAEPDARFAALTLQALADGLTDATVLIRYEDRWHSESQRSQSWIAHQQKKVDDAMAYLNRRTPPRTGVDVGQIALACALGFTEKHAGTGWRAAYPALGDWLDGFAARAPAYAETRG